MEIGRRGVARLAVRRPRHASLHRHRGAVRGRAAANLERRSERRVARFAHSSGLHDRLGPGRGAVRTVGRSPRSLAGASAHDSHLRDLHRARLFRHSLVAPADISISRRARHRRRMGRRRLAALGNMAATLAAVDRGGVADSREYRLALGRRGHFSPGRRAGAMRVSGRSATGAAGLVDPPRGARARGVACGPRASRAGASP